MSELSVIGLNHRTAPVGMREQFALSAPQILGILREVHRTGTFEEALLLSTCNRTELYFVARSAGDPVARLLHYVAEAKGVRPEPGPEAIYRHDAIDAVRHLFRVAVSLDSQIVGEHQILGQVKDAYRLAVEARTARFLLNKTLHRAFRVGKRVLSETALGQGCASTAQAAVELARQIFSGLSGATVLLVGAGQTAEAAARALVRAGAARLIVANRTVERAAQLARDLARAAEDKDELAGADGGAITCPALLRMGVPLPGSEGYAAAVGPPAVAAEAIGLEDIPGVIEQVALVVTSTGSPEPVLTWPLLADRLRKRRDSLLVVDIAVPRDVDPRLATLPNVYVYNIDDLDQLVAENLRRRQQEIPLAESIVEDEVGQFGVWLTSLQVAPTIRQLQQHFEELQKAQIERFHGRFNSTDQEQLARFTGALCNKILHQPLAYLRSVAADAPTSDVLATIEMIRQMFDLNGEREQR